MSCITARTVAGKPPAATDEQQVRATIAAFEQATLHSDVTTICTKLLAPALANSPTQYGRTFESVWKANLKGVVAPQLTVRSVRVIGPAASAEVHTQAIGQEAANDKMGLVHTPSGWRISSLS